MGTGAVARCEARWGARPQRPRAPGPIRHHSAEDAHPDGRPRRAPAAHDVARPPPRQASGGAPPTARVRQPAVPVARRTSHGAENSGRSAANSAR
ncbi:MAG: hypothetical protein D6689_04430 [Deltaproteobacteria bacterium]|nr:MAG: hypothetical protein D6689_04430 [Deltaproteobacteria bacterium]